MKNILKICSVIFTVLLLFSCTTSTQRIVVPSKNFSMAGPPTDWQPLPSTGLPDFTADPHKTFSRGAFTALWSKKRTSRISFIAVQIPDPGDGLSSATEAAAVQNIIQLAFEKHIEELRRTSCNENLVYTITNRGDRLLEQGARIHEIETAITCTAPRSRSFLKQLIYMFYQGKHLYTFELLSLQSAFDGDRQVLDAMLESFVFDDQLPQGPPSATTISTGYANDVQQEGQVEEKTFIRIQQPDVVFSYGYPRYTVTVGDTLEVIRSKRCRSGSGTCWMVKNVVTGEIGAVSTKQMKSRHSVYSARQPDLAPAQPDSTLPPRMFIEIQHPEKLFKGGRPAFTVASGNILEVLQKKQCKSGYGECWGVQDIETGNFGYVKADRMRSRHRIFYDLTKDNR